MKTTPNKKGQADYIDKYVGERIKSLRISEGMSQQMQAELVGVTFQQVQKYEKGTNRISSSRLYRIVKIFKCRFEDLFPPEEGDAHHLLLDKRTVKILRLCKSIETQQDFEKLKAAVKLIEK